MEDLITICIPTYRRPTAVLHCLHSCFIQDYRPLEIDISDNSPNDETRSLVESLAPPDGIAVRYWRNIPATDAVENQRLLFASARGRRFVWMNDDDVLLPGAVRAMADAFALAPDVIVAYGAEELINPAGELLPELTVLSNAEYERVPAAAGLRRDLLVCAFWQQISHVGFLVLTEAARKVGLRSREEVGLAVDTDFAIRLGQAYKGYAHVFLDRMTVRTRMIGTSLSQTAADVCWKFYDSVVRMEGLSPNEAAARDRLLRRMGPTALREHSLAYRRRAAMRILRSRTYPYHGNLLRMAYSWGLIVMPSLAFTMRGMAKARMEATTALRIG